MFKYRTNDEVPEDCIICARVLFVLCAHVCVRKFLFPAESLPFPCPPAPPLLFPHVKAHQLIGASSYAHASVRARPLERCSREERFAKAFGCSKFKLINIEVLRSERSRGSTPSQAPVQGGLWWLAGRWKLENFFI